FQKNLQGDVIALVDANAQVVARYTYDAWGSVTGVKTKDGTAITSSTHVANINPFRYRGYYLDRETGLYYLQSRYYDPVVGRFVNGDEAGFACVEINHLKCNLYCYCMNNVMNYVDYTGYDAWAILFDVVILILPFVLMNLTPVGLMYKIVKSLLVAAYIARIIKAIVDIKNAKEDIKNGRNDYNTWWTLYTSWLAVISNSILLVLAIIGITFKMFSSRVQETLIAETLHIMNLVWGTAFFGSLVLNDIVVLLTTNKKPKRREVG
ncbi:MAG: RHS repeat-associated core domain-containing protein, partial [Lachnospiraceae bacterium]|nr:RHS repeat-associated core domain-containing protein [Lachnospiraceae bacterium]